MIKTLLSAAAALGVLASPAAAQMDNTMENSTAPMAPATTTKTTTMTHTTKTGSMSMTKTMTHHHMTRAQMKTMKWCHSMSAKKRMHYKSCRMMMHHHMTMHHHHMTMPKKAM